MNRPSLEDAADGAEMVVTIQCAFPWDQDSDASDNEARLILSGGSVNTEDGFEWGTATGSAVLVIALALTLTWILYNQRERRKLLDMTESVLSKKKQESDLPQPTPSSEISQPTSESISSEAAEESPDIVERELDDFENRLKRLTGDD